MVWLCRCRWRLGFVCRIGSVMVCLRRCVTLVMWWRLMLRRIVLCSRVWVRLLLVIVFRRCSPLRVL